MFVNIDHMRKKDSVSLIDSKADIVRHRIEVLKAHFRENKTDVYLRGIDNLYLKVQELKLIQDETSSANWLSIWIG